MEIFGITPAAKKVLSKILPLSPFQPFIERFAGAAGEYLGWINWLIPVGEILGVFAAWLAAVGLFYAWSVLLRWAKIIGD